MLSWFNLFSKKGDALGRTGDDANPNDRVKAYYEGEVDTADYWDPDNIDDYWISVLLPHGFGKFNLQSG